MQIQACYLGPRSYHLLNGVNLIEVQALYKKAVATGTATVRIKE
jgi:hypothetical protein